MKAVCTICSKDKRAEAGLLPASQRYLSQRIIDVMKVAKQQNVPFLILSGKFGLIPAEREIPFYDHLLQDREVEELSKMVKRQIQELGVTTLEFYAKPKDTINWGPYYETLEKSAAESGVGLTVKLIR